MKPLKPKEVRLGNLTSHGVVSSIDRLCFTANDGRDVHFSTDTDILPVPLTPDILEGFGFVRDENVLCLEINNNSLDYLTAHPEDGVELYDHYGDVILLPEMKHAHTLQNFVQAISGVELVYKPNPN